MFDRDVLGMDPAAVAAEAERAIREQVLGALRRRGAVVGMSGGIDSSVVATLCARALGPDKVLGLLMPERDSSPDALRLGRLLAAHLGIRHVEEDVAPALEGLGCYARQLEAIRAAVPEYGPGWRCKLVLPSLLDGERLNITTLTVEDPAGARCRLPAARGGHQLQAAGAQDDGVLSRRSSAIRSRRDTQPPGI